MRREAEKKSDALRPLLEQSVELISEGESRVKSDRKFFMASVLGLAVVLIYTLNLEFSVPSLAVMVSLVHK